MANGTAGSSQGARSAARRHTAAHRWRGGTQRTRAIGVEKVERLANLLLLLLRERLLGLGGRPFRGGHSRGRAVALTVFGRCRNSYLFSGGYKGAFPLFGFARPQLRLEAAAAAAVGGAEVLHHPATGADVKVGRPVDVGGAPRLSS